MVSWRCFSTRWTGRWPNWMSRTCGLRFMGESHRLEPDLRSAMRAAETRTGGNNRLDLSVAVAYGGRGDLVNAARSLARQAAAGTLDPDDIDAERFAAELEMARIPDVDLLIRTGSDRRISNFVLWSLAYSELYFSDVLWPDFGSGELLRAIEFYASRQRRFGRTAQQIESKPVLRARVITALVLAGGMTVTVLYFPTWAVAGVIGLFCLGGVWEWAGLTRLHGAARWVYLSAFALLMLGLARWGLDRGWTANTIMAVAVCWWGLAALTLRIRPQRIPLYLVGATGPLALLPAWFLLTHLHANAVQGPSLTLSIMLIVWAADVGGHFVGGNWGRVKLAPRVSPAKTWEGLIGGMALATLFAFSAGLLLDLPAGDVCGHRCGCRACIRRRRPHGEHAQAQHQREGQRLVASRTRGNTRSNRRSGRRRTHFFPRARCRGLHGMNESEPTPAGMV